jgi:hypothetical protein
MLNRLDDDTMSDTEVPTIDPLLTTTVEISNIDLGRKGTTPP